MERFENYTYGGHILIESDHKPLGIITRKTLLSAPKRLQRIMADALSKAYLSDKTERSTTEKETDVINMISYLPMSAIEHQFWMERPPEIQVYYPFRDELVVQNGVIIERVHIGHYRRNTKVYTTS